MGTGQSSLRRIIPVIVWVLALPIWSCSDDIVDPPGPTRYGPSYKDLSADGPRDNLLYNLRLAYNNRMIERYVDLLDIDFVFFFSDEDVLNGTPEYWSRATEINANKNMFDPNYSNPVQEPIRDIDLVLAYTEGDGDWTSFDAPDQVRFRGETWYAKTVTYNLTITMPGDFQYISRNKDADFTLRAATRDTGQYWKIVVWRDDTGTGYARLNGGASALTVEAATWGRIKSLYKG